MLLHATNSSGNIVAKIKISFFIVVIVINLEASYGEVGRNVYLWMEDGILWLGVEITESDQLKYWDEPHAFALEIGRDEEEIERIERRKKWFSVY